MNLPPAHNARISAILSVNRAAQDALWSLVDSIELMKYHLATNVAGLVLGAYLTYGGFTSVLGLRPIVSMIATAPG